LDVLRLQGAHNAERERDRQTEAERDRHTEAEADRERQRGRVSIVALQIIAMAL